MAQDSEPKWRRIPKTSFNSKDLARRVKKAEGATVKHARRFVFKRWDSFREARHHVALWALTIGIIIGATSVQMWWYQSGFRTEAHANSGTYAEAVLGPVDTLNPIFARTSAEESAGELLFSRLITYDASGHLNYDLADSMKLSEDRKSYIFTIRPDARWSDGMYVRARDVVFTVKLIQNPATRSTLTGWNDVKVRQIDDRTVAFDLPAVYAPFPHALRFLPILPEHILRDVEPSQVRENVFSSAPVGSGPFTLRLIQDIDRENGRKIIHLARNETYYRGQAKLGRIQLHVYKDADAIKRALLTAEVNAASDLSVINAYSIGASRHTVEQIPTNGGVYAILNTKSPILQDIKVRMALQAGTDTSEVRKAISANLPELHLPILQSQVDADLPAAPRYDTKRAAQLLDEAGWVREGSVRKKDGQTLTLSIVTTKNTDFEKALEVISSQWRELGVAITTSIVDPTDPAQNVTQDILQPRRYDVLLHQLAIGGDPDVYGYWHSSQVSGVLNLANYSNAISDEALASARSRVEPELRAAKYVTFTRQWLHDVPAIGLYQSTAQYVHTGAVHSVDSSASIVSAVDRYQTVLYWSVGTRSVYKTP